jgi:hypothetical protein
MNSRVRHASDAFERKLRKNEVFNEEQVMVLKEAFEVSIEIIYNDIIREMEHSIREIASTNWRKAKEY